MVIIQNNLNYALNEQLIISIAQDTANMFNKGDNELLLRFVDKNEMTRLNNKYRNNNKVTNILAFETKLPVKINTYILGDIVICITVIAQEAKIQNKLFSDHLIHIIIHGILHLLGYRHTNGENAKKMEALEVKILKKHNIANPYLIKS